MTDRPRSTYRLQVRASFDLDAVADVTGYLRDLGADWVYLSPLLEATAGSDHGYDVVDHSRVDPARGGPDALARASAAARAHGLGVLVDIVPNHVGVSDAAQNAWWWDLLLRGEGSRYAEAFDVDWAFGGGRVRLPVLGGTVEAAAEAGDLRVVSEAGGDELRYFEHRFPIADETDGSVLAAARAGSSSGGGVAGADAVLAVHAAQHYELIDWRRADAELDYRRFFAVSTLAAIRVEVPWVFDESHAEILRWLREGLVDGLRVDHPDGLADPSGYLERLTAATGGAYVLVEKILEHGERLPAGWEADGTTGYDALADVDRLFVDPAGEDALTRAALPAGAEPIDWAELIHGTKRAIADGILRSEVLRLVRLPPPPAGRVAPDEVAPSAGRAVDREAPERSDDAYRDLAPDEVGRVPRPTRPSAGNVGLDTRRRSASALLDQQRDAIAELLACFPVYRSYLPLGAEQLVLAEASARSHRPDLGAAFDAIVPLLADPATAISRRFQQTSGMVMAKGVEDTAFYRYTRLGTLTEVGADPSEFAIGPSEFHARAERRQSAWPHSMTTLSTHDTKRGEDVRARLSVLSELPARWASLLDELEAIAGTGDRPLDALLWQAIIGAWPASRERLHAYAEKAAREAGDSTTWWAPDTAFQRSMHALVDAAFDDSDASALVSAFVDEIAPFGWSNSLGAKLVQVAGPGVPDVYQGSELWETSLVDPDNRRPVDFDERRRMLAVLDAGFAAGDLPAIDATGAAKLLVTSRALRLRRDRPDLFTRYTPLDIVGPAAAHAIAFDRGGAVAVATRLPVGLAARGPDPWEDTVLLRHSGPTVDLLTGRRFDGSAIRLSELLDRYPVALLGPVGA